MILPLLNLVSHDSVAFTSHQFQFSALNDLHVASPVLNHARLLQNSRGDGHAGAASSQHLSKQLLG